MHERACGAAGLVASRAARGAGFTPPDADEHYSPDLRLEPVHLRLSVRVDIPARTLWLTVGMRVKARSGGSRTLALDGVDLRELRVEPSEVVLAYDSKLVT